MMFKYANWDKPGVQHASVCIICVFFLKNQHFRNVFFILFGLCVLGRRKVPFILLAMF